MKILIVEDDDHKLQQIRKFITKHFHNSDCSVECSVRSGVLAVYKEDYDLVLLDMALPTFDKGNKTSGGVSQPHGGLELIRTISATGKKLEIIILTQFPDIELDGVFYLTEDSAKELSKRYNCSVLGSILYRHNNKKWEETLLELMSSI